MTATKRAKVWLTQPDVDIQKMFIRHGHEITFDLKAGNICVFPGGSDVIPVLYGEKPIPGANYSLARDLREVKFHRIIPRNIPKIGICRGAQFLNVMCGGSLWQDVDGHLGNHMLIDGKTKEEIEVTSTHHQMMIPPSHARILAWANKSNRKENEKEIFEREPDGISFDPEVVWFKDEKTLCFQPHPEYNVKSCEEYFFHLLDNFIFNRI